MRRLLSLALALVGLTLFAAAPAGAHTRSETHSAWQVAGSTVHLQFTMPDIEAKRLADPGQAMPSSAKMAAYLTKNLGVSAKEGACKLTEPARQVTAAADYTRFEFTFACPSDQDIVVSSHAFFDIVPTHTNFAQIQTADGRFFEQLMTIDKQSLPVSGAAAESDLAKANFLDYVRMGIMHIFTGVDHMSFLVGLVLISKRLKDLTFVITGFTVGHSITLGLAVTGVLRPHAEFIDALVALTIALIGAENISVSTHKPAIVALATGGMLLAMTVLRLMGIGTLPVLLLFGAGLFTANYLMVSGHLRDAAKLRLVVTVVFGLIHGFGFAAGLLEEKIPQSRLFQLLFGFNIGVEIGQLTLVVGLSLLVYWLMKLKLTLPRPIVVDVCASALVCVGMYWFIQRSF
ncbi:MAG TPA: HupE/UreJ family protein [Caulobacteraceae bacterium]|jgi:hypothetical protein|nr:HupE/UreJ family protein [Caulobacteraceae bacterium]